MPRENDAGGGRRSPPAHKMELADLEARVMRLELELRELEAREKMHEIKSRMMKQRTESGRGGKGRAKAKAE